MDCEACKCKCARLYTKLKPIKTNHAMKGAFLKLLKADATRVIFVKV